MTTNVDIKQRYNRKELRWCNKCKAYTIKIGDEYFKVWDGRISGKFHASFCVECFQTTQYNDIYENFLISRNLKVLKGR